jgi:hypothetical protein
MPSNDANKGTLMLDLYDDIHAFVRVLRAADIATRTKAEMAFVMDLRIRWSRYLAEMRITKQEHKQLQALAARGGLILRTYMPSVSVECSA